MRLIVNTVLYNEAEFITCFLDNLNKIRDLYAVELLDGSWEQGNQLPINSVDRTEQLINNWKENNYVPFEVNYYKSSHVWRTESEKRNHILKLIEKKYGRCWTLMLDADEFIRFPSGLGGIWLINDLLQHIDCGIINAYAYHSTLEKALPVLRFIPSCEGIHYHTELAMIIHDDKCNIIMDYNPGVNYKSEHTWVYPEMFLVNYWTLRNNKRQNEKYQYYLYQKNQNKGVKCKWEM